MNQFVNPSHRGVDLPTGCKDLIELIGNTWTIGNATKAEILQHPDYQPGTFGHIEFHICRLFMSKAQVRTLSVGCLESKVVVSLMHRAGALTITLVVPAGDGEREVAVRSLFGAAGFVQSLDRSTSTGGTGATVLKFPLPASAPKAAQIVADLLARGFGLTEDEKLIFYHHESPCA